MDAVTGYTFGGWTVKDSNNNTISVSSNTFTMPSGNVTVTGAWTANTYTVTYGVEQADGTNVGIIQGLTSEDVKYNQHPVNTSGGDAALTKAVATVNGYNPTGWNKYSKADDGTLSLQGYVSNPADSAITENTVFKAVFKKTYVVNYEKGTHGTWSLDSTDPASQMSFQDLQDGAAMPANALDPSDSANHDAGWIFIGWQLGDSGTTAYGVANENKEFAKTAYGIADDGFEESLPATVTHNYKLIAMWRPTEQALTFDKNNAQAAWTGADPSMTAVATDATVTMPAASTVSYAGHTLKGWSTEQDPAQQNNTNTYAPGSNTYKMPATATTLYAVWSANPVSIKYEVASADAAAGMGTVSRSSEGALNADSPATDIQGSTATANPGYEFTFWSKKSDASNTPLSTNATYTPSNVADETYVAHFQPISYTVRFASAAGGSVNSFLSRGEGFAVAYNRVMTDTTKNPAATHPGLANAVDFLNNNGVVAQAGYEAASPKWTYTYTPAGSLTPVTATTSDPTSVTILGDTTFTAQWTKKTYSVHYDLGYGGKTLEPKNTTWDGATAGLLAGVTGTNAPTRTGYTFDGWYVSQTEQNNNTRADATGFTTFASWAVAQGNTDGSQPTVTLYAKWNENSSYTVKYDPAGGAWGSDSSVRSVGSQSWTSSGYESLGRVSGLQPTRAGYTFDGWYTDTNRKVSDSMTYGDIARTDKTEVTLTAHWMQRKDYVVNYVDPLDSNNVITSQTGLTWDQFIVPSSTKPTKNGYLFKEWYYLDSSNHENPLSSSTKVSDIAAAQNHEGTASDPVIISARWSRLIDLHLVVYVNDDPTQSDSFTEVPGEGGYTATIQVPEGTTASFDKNSLYFGLNPAESANSKYGNTYWKNAASYIPEGFEYTSYVIPGDPANSEILKTNVTEGEANELHVYCSQKRDNFVRYDANLGTDTDHPATGIPSMRTGVSWLTSGFDVDPDSGNVYAPTRPGYTFEGWGLTAAGTKNINHYDPTGTTVDPSAHAGEGDATRVVNVDTFADLVERHMPNDKSTTLYAKWKEKKSTIHYMVQTGQSDRGQVALDDGNNNFSDWVYEENVGSATGKPIGAIAKAKPGWHFTGWKVSQTGLTNATRRSPSHGPLRGPTPIRPDQGVATIDSSNNPSLEPSHTGANVFGDTVVYVAEFERNATVSIDFAANGDTEDPVTGTVPDSMMQVIDLPITLPEAGDLARTNYTFGGWNTQPNGKGTTYQPGDSYTVTGAATLYAKWNPVAYPVTFPNGQVRDVDYGTTIPKSVIPKLSTPSGKKLSGYKVTVTHLDGTTETFTWNKSLDKLKVKGPTVIEALWTNAPKGSGGENGTPGSDKGGLYGENGLPSTGDIMHVVIPAIVLIALAAAVVLLVRRKMDDDSNWKNGRHISK